jgi:hypothetical protein
MSGRLALLLAFALVPRLAGAGEPGLRFEWRVPQGCPARADVLMRVEKLLGRPLAVGAPADLELEAHVAQVPEQPWKLHLLQRSSNGMQTRMVEATSCEELADAAALFLALSIDPSLASASDANASGSFPSENTARDVSPALQLPPEPTPLPGASAAVDEASPPARLAVPERPLRLHAGLGLAIATGRMPRKALGGVLHIGLARRSWLWLAELSAAPEQRANAAGSAAGGDIRLLGLSTGMAYMIDFEPMSFGPMGGVELGWLHGSGNGVDNPARADALLLGLQAGFRYALGLSREWALLASATGSMLANRPRFVLDGIGPVYQPERWGARLGVGVEWHTP